ncbi:MAG: SgcJ/EcaC family oxidoreductase [Chitinophagaceae bacterium]|nr:MAG: SgcJ/EcaC family oxidoreductase [Chitinophagaceae bacterium]
MKIKTVLLTPVLLLFSSHAFAANSTDSTLDRKEITQLVKNYEDAWNRHDFAGLAKNYTIDATWVNWFGAMYTGRADIQSHYETTHSTYFKDTRYYTRSIEDITFIKPDVAVIHVRTGLTGDSRYPGQVFEFRRMMVLTKTDGQWLIFAGQNAKLNEGVK